MEIIGVIVIIILGFVIYDIYKTFEIALKGNKNIDNSVEFINTNLKKAKKYTQIKISKSYLTGCAWTLIAENENIQYIFRSNSELLISNKGIITKCDYELIIDNDSIIITQNNIIEKYDIVLVKNDFLFLNKISENQILSFANQTKFKDYMKPELIKMANELLLDKF